MKLNNIEKTTRNLNYIMFLGKLDEREMDDIKINELLDNRIGHIGKCRT